MNERTKQKWHTVTWTFIIVGTIGLLLAIAIPSFVKSKDFISQPSCINILRGIQEAKAEWAKANGKTNGDPVVEAEVNQYIRAVFLW